MEPTPARTFKSVPVIDLGDSRHMAIVDTIAEACTEWGFFQVVGHGIEEPLLQDTLTQMRRFFAQPGDAKASIRRTGENPWGFNDQEFTKNERDWKEIFDVGARVDTGPLAGSRPQWPDGLPGFRRVMEDYASACEQISRRVLGFVGESLGEATDRLGAAFPEDHTSFLRLNYYPKCDDPAPADSGLVPESGHLGIQRHTDAGALTVLLQDDQPGLQVWHEDAWHTIEPRSDALVINIGDIVQVWSNDRYRAALHRVLADVRTERYSAPYFFNPSCETHYAPLPGACSEQRPARYRAISWEEFRAGRAAGDYANLGTEIQIDHFRIDEAG